MDVDNNDKEILSINIHERNWIVIGGKSFVFSGQCSISKNGIYILAWKDARIFEDEKTGRKKFVDGEFLLLENKILILKGRLSRPNDGKIANNGTFIFNDWIGFPGGLNGKGLEGNFLAFDKNGKEIVRHHYSANLWNNGLSANGRYAVCQTAHSKTSDASTVTCFDLKTGNLLWQKKPETDGADEFDLDSDGNTVCFVYNKIGKFEYSLTGEFLDDDKWRQSVIDRGSGVQLINIADRQLEKINSETPINNINEILNLYFLAAKRIKDSPYFLTKAHRSIGEIYELLGNVNQAIVNYEKALKINPKAGVKKKLQKLKVDNKILLPPNETPPFSIKTFESNSIQFEDLGEYVRNEHLPKGTYSIIHHYNDASWYIKNHRKLGVATVSIATIKGELLKTIKLNNLVYRARRADTSNCFAIISPDLMLYVYSSNFSLIATKKIFKEVNEKPQVKSVCISPDGNLIAVTKGDSLKLYNKNLREITNIKIPQKTTSDVYESEDFAIEIEGVEYDGILVAQIFDNNLMCFGTHSGEVHRFQGDGSTELIHECKKPIRDIKKVNSYLYIISDKFIDVLKDQIQIHRIKRMKERGHVVLGDAVGLEFANKTVRLFRLKGLPVAEIEFSNSIIGAYLYEDRLRIFVNDEYFTFKLL